MFFDIVLTGLFILCIWRLVQLSKQVQALQKKWEATQKTPQETSSQEQEAQLSSQETPAEAVAQPSANAQTSQSPEEANWVASFIDWLKEDWLLKLGSLLLLIGFGWLTSYAFAQGWIGPIGRITLGIIGGVGILILGWWRIRTHSHQGGIFIALGSAVVVLTIFAAREVYEFFTPVTGIGVMLLSIAFVAFASARFRLRWLSFAGLILAALAPLLVNVPEPDPIGLFAYIIVIIGGTIWTVAYTGWRNLIFGGFIVAVLYSIPYIAGVASYPDVLVLFAYALVAIFFIASLVALLYNKGNVQVADLFTAGGNGLFLIAWTAAGIPETWQSIILAGWMLVFAVGSYVIFQATREQHTFYVYAGVAVTLLAAATAIELEGAALTIAYTIEIGVVVLSAAYALRNRVIASRASILLLGPIALSAELLAASVWENAVFHAESAALFVLTAVLLGLGLYFASSKEEGASQEQEVYKTGVGLLVAGSLYVYALIWLSLHALFIDDMATTVALIIYTIAGLASYAKGALHGKHGYRIYGGIVLGAVVVRLLMVEMQQMELVTRIITFFVIGTLLAGSAFIGRKSTKSPDTEEHENNTPSSYV